MRYAWFGVLLALTGCALMKDVADSAKEVVQESGADIVEKVVDVTSGDPTAIIAAAGAVAAAVAAIVIKVIRKRKAAK